MNEILTSVTASVVTVAVIGFIAGEWMKARVVASIKHEYDKEIEALRAEFRIRESGVRIAALLSEAFCDERNRDFNKLAWELSITLPDDAAKAMVKVLVDARDVQSLKTAILEVRRSIRGGTALAVGDIVHRGELRMRGNS